MPLATVPVYSPQWPPRAPISPGCTSCGLHILIVDDNEDTRDILGTYLEHPGAAVTPARNGGEALAALNDIRAHIIVSDISMPAVDGIELMTRIRARESQLDIRTPAIAFTGFSDGPNEQAARQAGFDAFVAKPADPLDIALCIDALTRDV